MTHTLPHRQVDMTRQIRLLVDPFTIPMSQRPRGGRTTWLAVDLPALLDQLREEGCTPSGGSLLATVRRRTKDSQPPLRGDSIDTLSEIEVSVAGWHARLDLPSPDRALDWFKAAIRQIEVAELHVESDVARELHRDVNRWYADCARAVGWRLDDLRAAQ